MIDWIDGPIHSVKPGDEDLLTAIQGIERLGSPLFGKCVPYSLVIEVVNWLQVGSSDSCKPNESLMDDG